MGSATPPKRMTRARAAAASATATTLSTKSTKSDRVTKSAKATPSTKATAASAKKPAATKKVATTTATATATAAPVAAPEKPAEVKKPVAKTATTVSTTTTRPITRKRKAQTSDSDDEDDLCKEDTTKPTMNRPAKKLRGSAKKAVDPKTESESEHESESQSKSQEPDTQTSTAATTRSTRGRPKRSTATATTPTTTTETSSTTKGKRTRKTTPKADDAATTTKPAPKKRGRAATGTITTTYTTEPTPGLKSAVSRPTSKLGAVLKKTVTFQEPEKENVPPKTAKNAKTETTTTTATGLRAKPVRKPAASGRTTRASARAAITDVTEKIPLSPKKDGQNLPLSRDVDSDDELATYEKTPLKPLMKSPVKPTRSVRKLELPAPEKEEDSDPSQTLESVLPSVLSSPARRLPPTPFKDTMKSPAKRLDGIPSLIFPSATTETQDAQSPSKPTLLQSPAKRSHISLPAFQFNQDQVGTVRSPVKMFFGTPAKRPSSPLKLLSSSVSRIEEKPQEASKDNIVIMMEEDDDADTTVEEDECILHTSIEETEDMETPTKEKNNTYSPTEEISEEELQSQIRAEIGSVSPNESVAVEKSLSPIPEADNEDSIQFESPTPQLSFPGRLSAVLPRYADPALKQNPLPVSGLPNHSPQLNCAEPQQLEPVTTRESPKNDLVAKVPSHEPMDSSDASSEKQPVELRTAESEAGRIDVSEEKSTEVLDACESNEQATAVSEPQSDKREAQAEDPNVLSPTKITPTKAARKRAAFGLRGKQLEGDCMSDSEDELALSNKTITKHQDATSASDPQPMTPAPLFKGTDRKISESAARAASRAIRSVSKTSQLGFSVQLGAWRASSPLKGRQTPQKPAPQPEDDDDEFSLLDEKDFPVVETPSAKGFFDDEMKIRDDMENQAAIEALLEADIAAKFDKHDFHDLGLMDDISFVAEDERMSPLNTREADSSRSHDESISDASQEYGDENVVPIDPALVDNKTDVETGSQNPVTPQKRTFASREVHTVSKVPLKRGDDSPPRSVKRHCSTVSKISLHRSSQMELQDQTDEESRTPLVTPSKSAHWSSMGTPARTTRPDLNTKLLSGAIVFVDVHTTEGADAGRIFVDLLVQMGARCVKSWPWNPSNTTDGQVDVSKIGITHVVFKDGGKRTLEKVVESNGAVQCVGVSWVLDCEKENKWVNEKDYRVDPALIPRGGHNRRKSMEPKAIANMNGTLVTPMKINSSARDLQMVPNNYMSRRDSTVWMRSPSDHDEDEDAPSEPSEMDWETTDAPVLTPVPKTPAPEMVARFAMDISPGTPTTSSFASTNELLMQTCPPKSAGLINIGESFVSGNQDPVSMRLMAARRKSMQFAPRVASPLKKQWK